MAYPAFDAVRPSRSSSSGHSGAQRVAALVVLLATSAIALSFTFGGSSEQASPAKMQAQLFEEPSISLGIREHEALFHGAPKQQQSLKAADSSPEVETAIKAPVPASVVNVVPVSSKPVQALVAQKTSLGDFVDISHPNKDRWNYQLDSKATWPPHDNEDIPTGAYAKTYKGPYDPDYNWPDDTQVVRNDEWDQSGGVGCGMYGNSC